MTTKHNRELWPYEPKRTQDMAAWLDKNIAPSFHTEARQMMSEPQVLDDNRKQENKKTRASLWDYGWHSGPQILTDDEQEAAYIRPLEQEEPQPTSPLAWCVYGLVLLLAVLGGWHFVAWWLQGAPL